MGMISQNDLIDTRKISKEGANLIKTDEGLILKVEPCLAGQPTIGWGHAIQPGEDYRVITEEIAQKLFDKDIKTVEFVINRLVLVKLNQNQFDALCSNVFNRGVGKFARSTGLKELNKGNFDQARWELFIDPLVMCYRDPITKELVHSKGLENRRKREMELWDRAA